MEYNILILLMAFVGICIIAFAYYNEFVVNEGKVKKNNALVNSRIASYNAKGVK